MNTCPGLLLAKRPVCETVIDYRDARIARNEARLAEANHGVGYWQAAHKSQQHLTENALREIKRLRSKLETLEVFIDENDLQDQFSDWVDAAGCLR